SGTVVTLMMDDQRREVSDLMRKAGIRPTTTVAGIGHPVLQDLAPGERTFPGGWVNPTPPQATQTNSGRGRSGARSSGRSSGGRSTTSRAAGGRATDGSSSARRDQQAPAASRAQGQGSCNGQRSQRSGQASRGRRTSSGGAAGFSARMGRG
ncbi:MAG: RNA helicase, partial [Propionibacteriaceae bacterium]|nr:RNA helicase [Propionibacteriaceae bacterium]